MCDLLQDLPTIIIPYVQFFTLPSKSLFHNLISLIISQKIRFSQSRKIRQQLYALLNTNEYTIDNLDSLSNDTLKSVGLSDDKINCIRSILKIENLTLDKISKIKGVGPWTLKALQILTDANDDLFLSEDYYIRQRFSELIQSNKILTTKQLDNYIVKFPNWIGQKTVISRFFWRIKPEGIIHLLQTLTLTRDDFL